MARSAKVRPLMQRDRMVYRGYFIIHNHMTDHWYVSRDEFHITATVTLEEAKAVIDGLLD